MQNTKFLSRMRWVMKSQLGMSLLEIIIAIGIVGAVGGYIVTKVFQQSQRADTKQAQAQLNDLVANVKLYKREKKEYPTSDQGLTALVDAGIIEEVPTDPWGADYNYASPGSHGEDKFEIWSNGADEQEDTEDDVVSWKKSEE